VLLEARHERELLVLAPIAVDGPPLRTTLWTS
jgi:hypothetical protein